MRSNTQELEKISILTESDRAHFFSLQFTLKCTLDCVHHFFAIWKF